MDWSSVFAEALPYNTFLDRHATPPQRQRWEASARQFDSLISAGHRTILGGFTRRMPVLCLAGAWCGDCIQQCPAFPAFAAAAPSIDLRMLDRDARPDVRDALSINGGQRVPVVVFLSEDFREVARFGDRTLAKYRKMAEEQLGAACPTGIVPPDDALTAAVIDEWLGHFERAHLILRLSPRLRQKHGD